MTKTILGCLLTLCVASASLALPDGTVDECQARIDLIQADWNAIADVQKTGDNIGPNNRIGGRHAQRTYDSLTSKLRGAKTKLDQEKYKDAFSKLGKVQGKVMSLVLGMKLPPADGALLLFGDPGSDMDEGLAGARDCVESLLF